MLDLLQNANLAVRLGVELALLVAVGYAAWRGIPRRSLRLVAVIATGLVLVRRARLAAGFVVVALANACLMAIWAQ